MQFKPSAARRAIVVPFDYPAYPAIGVPELDERTAVAFDYLTEYRDVSHISPKGATAEEHNQTLIEKLDRLSGYRLTLSNPRHALEFYAVAAAKVGAGLINWPLGVARSAHHLVDELAVLLERLFIRIGDGTHQIALADERGVWHDGTIAERMDDAKQLRSRLTGVLRTLPAVDVVALQQRLLVERDALAAMRSIALTRPASTPSQQPSDSHHQSLDSALHSTGLRGQPEKLVKLLNTSTGRTTSKAAALKHLWPNDPTKTDSALNGPIHKANIELRTLRWKICRQGKSLQLIQT